MELFQTLGTEVERLWRDANYDETVFPALAAEALEKANLPQKVSAWEVIEWTLKQTNLPEQRDLRGSFADPPITLYNSPRAVPFFDDFQNRVQTLFGRAGIENLFELIDLQISADS